jgi:hypothetical protein
MGWKVKMKKLREFNAENAETRRRKGGNAGMKGGELKSPILLECGGGSFRVSGS